MQQLTERQILNFEAKINKIEGGCHEWMGYVNNHGYGNFNLNGYKQGAHRVSYSHYSGELGHLHVLHKCDNRKCVNPNHLFLGTHQDNMDDMMEKGRHRTVPQDGANNGNHKLDEGDVLQIIDLLALFNNKEVALMFGTTHSNISCIRLGKTWKNIPRKYKKPHSSLTSLNY